jgi:hypothetical protein
LCIQALAAAVPAWRLAQSEHFEIYAQASDQRALAILQHFEQLRAFFQQQSGWEASSLTPVRVVVFASDEEYQPYRLRSTADAYYVGTKSQDYIVMATDGPGEFGLAAHEYAHLALGASGLQLPPWLKEGLAEFFATLRITEHGAELGGPLPGRVNTLQRQTWMPLTDLLSLSEESQSRQQRPAADLFYAESWALTEMLMLSPDYAPGFQKFGTPSMAALSETYSVEAVTRDLHAWINRPSVIHLPEVFTGAVAASVSGVSPLASRIVLAQVLLAAGKFDRAEPLFAAIAHDAPDSADVSAALGTIALHKGDLNAARSAWKRAIDQGITDAILCYRYAVLADQIGLGADDIRPALERAIALQPDFDDAHYQLALLEKNAGRYEAALQQFQAMRCGASTRACSVHTLVNAMSSPRAYSYWLALADTFNELGRREEAQSSAQHAAEHATTAAERARAAQQIYIAQTDPGVQFARDLNGGLQLVATRMPHQTTDWNPFVEPGDDVHRLEGLLREIDCGNVTNIRVEASGKLITLAIPDLQHVQMRHAPSEFVCGPQSATPVIVDYAQTGNATPAGVVRGMDFSPAPVSPASAP